MEKIKFNRAISLAISIASILSAFSYSGFALAESFSAPSLGKDNYIEPSPGNTKVFTLAIEFDPSVETPEGSVNHCRSVHWGRSGRIPVGGLSVIDGVGKQRYFVDRVRRAPEYSAAITLQWYRDPNLICRLVSAISLDIHKQPGDPDLKDALGEKLFGNVVSVEVLHKPYRRHYLFKGGIQLKAEYAHGVNIPIPSRLEIVDGESRIIYKPDKIFKGKDFSEADLTKEAFEKFVSLARRDDTTRFSGRDTVPLQIVEESKSANTNSMQTQPAIASSIPIAQLDRIDSRKVRDANSPKWLEAVGRLQIAYGNNPPTCTLTLLTDNPENDGIIGITPFHCIKHWQVNGSKFDLGGNTRYQDYDNISKNVILFTRKNGTKIFRHIAEVIHFEEFPGDFAIVKLNRAIPRVIIQPLLVTVNSYSDLMKREGSFASLAGYSADRALGSNGKNMTYHENCKLDEGTMYQAVAHCYSFQGASGGTVTVTTKYSQVVTLDSGDVVHLQGTQNYFVGHGIGGNLHDVESTTKFVPHTHYQDKLFEALKNR